MKAYNRTLLNSSRKEFGSLLHVEEGQVLKAGETGSTDASIEFRTGGVLIYSSKNNISDVISFKQISKVSLESGLDTGVAHGGSLILLGVQRAGSVERILLKIEHPEFMVQRLEMIIKEKEKASDLKPKSSSYADTIRDLNKLLEEGLLTEEEFTRQKEALLKRMTEE